jgi:uncharacterized membrane protein YjfL (UPF0719 family)
MDIGSVAAGFLAWALSVAASMLLVFGTFRLKTFLTRTIDEETLLRQGNRSVGIALGAVVLGQAILLRHAVFPSMVVLRELFLAAPSAGEVARAVGQCLLFFLVVGLLAAGSVALAGWLFVRMTGPLPETEEMLRDNVAVAVFYACVVLAVTVLVNEGLEDLSRSLIPHARTGIIHLP